MKKKHLKIIKHYENCLEKHGDNHLGVDWPNQEDVDKRYDVMLDIIRVSNCESENISLMDFGCGTAHLLEYINRKGYKKLDYSGLDISQKFIDVSRKKFRDNKFYCLDILNTTNTINNFDFFVLNGVFTEKRELSFDEMWNYFTKLISIVYEKCNNGVAFNVMSKSVDWEREDLFHLPLDILSDFLCKKITRNFIIRNDYGLYEYTVYLLKT